MMYQVKVYDYFNNTYAWEVDGRKKAREYAKRIITEGLWVKDEEDPETEVFYPVHLIIKVKIRPISNVPNPERYGK